MKLLDFKNPTQAIETVVYVVIGVLILVQMLPILVNAFINMSTISNIPLLSTFFGSGGVVYYALAAGLIIGAIKLFTTKGR